MRTKMKFLGEGFQKSLKALQTDRDWHTDRWTHYNAAFAGGNNNKQPIDCDAQLAG